MNATRKKMLAAGSRAALATVVMQGVLLLALSDSASSDPLELDAAPMTVLTMAPSGAWGAAIADSPGTAIAAAIAECRSMSRRGTGCGAYQVANRGGWALGIRCGSQSILVAERTLAEAEQAAIDRETALREQYVADMPPCVRVVSIDPSGRIVAPNVAALVDAVMQRPRRASP